MWQSHKSHCIFRLIGEKPHSNEFVDVLQYFYLVVWLRKVSLRDSLLDFFKNKKMFANSNLGIAF